MTEMDKHMEVIKEGLRACLSPLLNVSDDFIDITFQWQNIMNSRVLYGRIEFQVTEALIETSYKFKEK